MAKYLVVGQGSMGKRRVRCLLANSVPAERILVFDTRQERVAESVKKHFVKPASSVEEALRDPETEAVFVSVPGSLHLEYCLAAAKGSKHWFCEVPLSVRMAGLDELVEVMQAAKKQLIGAPGCQLLFHPLAKTLHQWAQESSQGNGLVLAGSYSFGSYLPDWHPYEDYRSFYAADQHKGGGNLDVIAQELTWLNWVLGQRVAAVTCRMSKLGPLELFGGTPDHQEIIVEYDSGTMLSMHFDINDPTHERWLRLCRLGSTAKWSTLEPLARIFDRSTKAWREETLPQGFDYESCYIQEVGQFLKSIKTGEPWPVPLSAAQEVVGVLEAMQQSAKIGRTVAIREVSG